MIDITITEIQEIYDFNNTLINIKVIVQGVDPQNPEYAHGFPFVIEGAELSYLQQFDQGTAEYAAALHGIIDGTAVEHFNAQALSGTLDNIINGDELEQALAGNITTEASDLLSLEGRKAHQKAEVSRVRYTYETQGVSWTDAAGDTFIFDTTAVSQGKLSAARIILSEGGRADGSVWKCLDPAQGKSVFKPLTNAEFTEITDAVYTHVQKCFDTERRCFDPIEAASTEADVLAVSYRSEFLTNQ